MATILFKYDAKDGELIGGQILCKVADIKVLGRNIKWFIEVKNREDRADGLVGGGIEMLVINYRNHEYASIEMGLDDLLTCCFPPVCHDQVCLDGCNLILDGCCVTLK